MEHIKLIIKEETKMSIKSLLDEEIRSEIEEISKIEVGSEKHKVSVDAIAKLLDKSIELEKLDAEAQEKYESRIAEQDLKREQIKNDKRDSIVKNVLTGVSVIGGFGLTVWGTCKSLKFEETGVVTSIMGRGFIQRLLPKK